MTYLIILFFTLLLSYHYDYRKEIKFKNEAYIVLLLIAICVAGLRFRIGSDTIGYEHDFLWIPSLDKFFDIDFSSSRIRPGYVLLASICKTLFGSFIAVQFVQAIIVNSIIFWFIYKNTNHIFIGVFIYFIYSYLYFNTEIMREAIAVAIFLISWKYFNTNKWIKYYICIYFACYFHTSAYILLLLPIVKLKFINQFFSYNYKTLIAILATFFLCAALSSYFNEYIRLISISEIETYSTIYNMDKQLENSSIDNIRRLITFSILNISYPAICFYIMKINKEKHIKQLETMICVSIYITVFSIFIPIFARFNNYFILFLVIMMSDTLYSKVKFRNLRLKTSFALWMIFLTPFLFSPLKSLTLTDKNTGIMMGRRYIPYENVIFPSEDEQREELYRSMGLSNYQV